MSCDDPRSLSDHELISVMAALVFELENKVVSSLVESRARISSYTRARALGLSPPPPSSPRHSAPVEMALSVPTCKNRWIKPLFVVPGEYTVTDKGSALYRGSQQSYISLAGPIQGVRIMIPTDTYDKLPLLMATITILAASEHKLSILLGVWDSRETNLVTDILSPAMTWKRIPDNVTFHVESWATRTSRGFEFDDARKLFVATIVTHDPFTNKPQNACITLPLAVGLMLENASDKTFALNICRKGVSLTVTFDSDDQNEEYEDIENIHIPQDFEPPVERKGVGDPFSGGSKRSREAPTHTQKKRRRFNFVV
jgi:hypothetical protein